MHSQLQGPNAILEPLHCVISDDSVINLPEPNWLALLCSVSDLTHSVGAHS